MISSREILEFITENENITLSKLSQLMGIKRAQPLYDIRDGKIKAISTNYVEKILAAFPQYNRVWLITGEGNPFSGVTNEMKNNSMTTSERFLKVMDGLDINPYILEKEIGVKYAQAKISHYKKGVTKAISSDIIIQLCEAYPQVNDNYILTGKGDMFLNTAAPIADMPKEGTEELPSPESAEYWERMYKSAVTTYEAMLQNLEERFNVLDKSLSGIREFLVERKKAV